MVVYSDCFNFFPSILHNNSPKNLRVLSNPILLMKHILGYIIRISIWNSKTLSKHGNVILNNIALNLETFSSKYSEYHPGSENDKSNCYSIILTHIASFCKIIAEVYRRSFGSGLNYTVLDMESAERLVEWVMKRDSAYMANLFILPLLTQFSCHRDNWDACTLLTTKITKSNADSLSNVVLKYLLATACNRLHEKDVGFTFNFVNEEKLDLQFTITQRMWAIQVLGISGLNSSEVCFFIS